MAFIVQRLVKDEYVDRKSFVTRKQAEKFAKRLTYKTRIIVK